MGLSGKGNAPELKGMSGKIYLLILFSLDRTVKIFHLSLIVEYQNHHNLILKIYIMIISFCKTQFLYLID